ncbi:MAG: DUF2066 domain-containing protein [Woeseiaceae bacterium]|nr:DUF2066 domain-containing protein [Woeseiaceae bacterium]
MKSPISNIAGWCRCVILSAIIVGGTASAVEMPTLFTAEVPLDKEADNPRADAYSAALVEILQKVSGTDVARDSELVEDLFPNPASYVMQFRPGADESLWVSFDGEAIENTLRSAGLTFWGAERPLTLVWLAVDWGQGTREIVGSDDPDRTQDESRSINRNRLLRERMLEIAEKRGLPIVFPLLDTTDLQSVSFADIWGEFDDPILDASKRYDANSVLIGRIRPSSSRQSRWTYHFRGTVRSYRGAPELVMAQIADLLAAEFAVGGNAPVDAVVLNVSGIVSVEAYGTVQSILKEVALIEDFAVTAVSGDTVSYRVDVRGGGERLRRALRFNGLVEQETVDPTQESFEFYYSP